MMNWFQRFVAVTSLALGSLSAMAIQGKYVEYKVGAATMQGYLATPSATDGRAPTVMIVHDWNGLDAYEEYRANLLAEMGYTAFCVDVYGKGVRPKNQQESAAEAGKYYQDNALLRARLKGAYDAVAKMDVVRKNQIVAIGYCFGGMSVLEMARMGLPLKGVASFHGSLKPGGSPMKQGLFKGALAVYHASRDPFVPPADVDAFKAEISAAKMEIDFVAYDIDSHPFTVHVPGTPKGAMYREEADKDSWAKFSKWLKAIGM